MDTPKLSKTARRSLEERLRRLEEERVPRLERELADSGDPLVDAALRATIREVAAVRRALATATPLEEEPHDPTVVELGDTVTVRRVGSAEPESFTLVGELEARLDASWISVESPLGSALLRSRTGVTVETKTPDGPVSYELLAIERS
ncbi:MAG: GreA/GreB family elongation factor [Actinomycetota bacterium]